MRLQLFHPGVARIDCRKCQKELYNLQTGELVTYKAGALGLKTYEVTEAPCQRGEVCPKESPEKAHRHLLSDRNWKTVNLYRRGRAIGFHHMPKDDLFAENMAIIDGLMRSWERTRAAEASGTNLALALIPLIARR